MNRPPLPPFTETTAIAKVRLAEDAWNSRTPGKVVAAYSEDTQWRNRAEFLNGRADVKAFLERKWTRELDYRLAKSLWAVSDSRIAVRFQYEYHTPEGQWFRAYGNEHWEFDDDGLMRRREASINEVAIGTHDRKFTWPSGSPRPADGFEIDQVR